MMVREEYPGSEQVVEQVRREIESMSRYYIRLRIGDMRRESEPAKKATCHSLYKVARSLVRWGRRKHVPVRFVVTDLNTGKTVFRMYARESERQGWIARQAGVRDNI